MSKKAKGSNCRVLPSHLPACHGKWILDSGKWISKPTSPNWQVDLFSGKWISKPTGPKFLKTKYFVHEFLLFESKCGLISLSLPQ